MNDATTQELHEPVNQVAEPENHGWDWGIVEIFGHRRHAGRVREEERFGTKMLRVDVPIFESARIQLPGREGSTNQWIERWETHYYSGSAIFSYAPTDEATVMRANKPYEPPSRFLAPPQGDEFDHEDGSDSDATGAFEPEEPLLPPEFPPQVAAPGADT